MDTLVYATLKISNGRIYTYILNSNNNRQQPFVDMWLHANIAIHLPRLLAFILFSFKYGASVECELH